MMNAHARLPLALVVVGGFGLAQACGRSTMDKLPASGSGADVTGGSGGGTDVVTATRTASVTSTGVVTATRTASVTSTGMVTATRTASVTSTGMVTATRTASVTSTGTGTGTGGSGGTGGVGGYGGFGGYGGTGAVAGASGSSIAVACADTPCIAALFDGCVPAGTCTSSVMDVNLSSTENDCYGNGVKQQIVTTYLGMSATGRLSAKLGSRTCYVMDVTISPDQTRGLMVMRDGSGTQVGTVTVDLNTNATVVTCTGGTPTRMSTACEDATNGSSSICMDGICVY